jgi:hypothetical protein
VSNTLTIRLERNRSEAGRTPVRAARARTDETARGRGRLNPDRFAPSASLSISIGHDPERSAFRRIPAMSAGSDLISLIARRQNLDDYKQKHWTGSFAEYLDLVKRDPKVTRTAYQRLYDMILSKGTEEIVVNKEKLLRYKFFEDPDSNGR